MMSDAERSSYIGGPDAAAIMGLDPYKTPMDVLAAKRGIVPPKKPSWPMKAGLALERLILEDYAERHSLVVVPQPGLRRHPRHHWAGSHVDADVPSVPRLVEAKTTQTDDGYGLDGTDQVRPGVLIQCVWYMAIWDRPECDVPVLFRNRELREYHVKRDLELEEIVFAACHEFWLRYVEGDEEYRADGSDAARRYLHGRYPLAADNFVEGTEADAAAMLLKGARQEQALVEREVAEAEARVMQLIGDAGGLRGTWGRITWHNERGRPNYAAICKDATVAPLASKLTEAYRTPGSRVLRVPRDWTHEADNE